ncbi:MAG TPA: copper-binding protein [Thermoanaerobaculia bacterium]
MKHVLIALIAVSIIACGKSQTQKPVDVAGQKIYELRGKIVSRNRGENTLNIDHEEIKGFMEAMTMDYSVRGAKVEQLPPDGSKIRAKLHVVDDGFWVSDVQKDSRSLSRP